MEPYRTPSPSHETRRLPMLRQLSTKTPCSTRWSEMDGDERSRLCFRCSKNVYKLDAMTEDEAESFLALHEDGFFRRPDGTILTENCTVGIDRQHTFNLAFSALVALTIISVVYFALHDVSFKSTEAVTPYQPKHARIEPPRQKSVVVNSTGFVPTTEPRAEDDSQFWGYAPLRPWQYEGFISVRDLSAYDPMPESKAKIKELYYATKGGNGVLPMDVIRRIMRMNMWRLRVCYDAYLLNMPVRRSGDLFFHFVIARDGSTAQAMILEHNPREFLAQAFGQCLTSSFKAISFPSPEGGVVSVDYWLDFVPPPPGS